MSELGMLSGLEFMRAVSETAQLTKLSYEKVTEVILTLNARMEAIREEKEAAAVSGSLPVEGPCRVQ